jgi:site-specific recombinase XerD
MDLISPIEILKTPENLDGKTGKNRAPVTEHKQIAADNDATAINAWLNEFHNSPQTHRAYRKEAERLLLWSIVEQGKPLSSLTREDMTTYQQFLASPHPTDRWCGPRKPRHNPDWRPFQGPLSESSRAQALSILSALFSFLVETGYLAGNPIGLIRKRLRAKDTNAKVERFFEQELWALMCGYIEALPRDTDSENRYYERIRYLISFFYLMGARINEVATHRMDSFHHRRGQWWWQVLGKGNKRESIPVNQTMLKALIRYRRHYGLTDLPAPADETPIFMNLAGNKPVTANRIHYMIKALFSDIADQIEDEYPHYADKLRQASAHWLRHTSITHQTDAGIDLRFIQRNARHSSVDTTTLYQHTEDDHWHRSMQVHTLFEEP